MERLLILYPSLFQCGSKFRRKLDIVTSQMHKFGVVWPEDPNGFVEAYANQNERVSSDKCEEDWKAAASITRAVVFDDGEEFTEEREWLKSHDVTTRWIRIPLTRVINIQHHPEFQKKKKTPTYEYIGRGSYWGNPYSMFEKGESREDVIGKYKYDFDHDRFPNKKKSEVFKLMGKRLGCFCKPAACHGDILADYLNSYDDGR